MEKAIHTEIEINASAKKVWGILSDFASFPAWNPFITDVYGNLGEGEKIKIGVQLPDSRKLKLDALISVVKPNEELRWGGGLPLGLFTGEHFYIIEKLEENKVKFVHGENFLGLIVRPLWSIRGKQLVSAYKLMNEAIKKRAEEVE